MSAVASTPTRAPARADRPIALELGMPGLPPPEEIRAAVARVLLDGSSTSIYAPPPGDLALRRRLARHRAERGLPEVAPDAIVVTHGASGALSAVLLAATEPGDEVACPDPGFPAFASLVRRFGRRLVTYDAGAAGSMAAALEEALSPRTRLAIWNSPSNPLGRVASETECAQVAELAAARGFTLLSDEVYEDLVFDSPHATPLAHDDAGRCVSVHSFSKSFSMPGWRVGYLVAPPELAHEAARAHWSLNMSVGAAAQAAAAGALAAAPAYRSRLVEAMRERCARVCSLLEEAGVPHERPAGGLFVWLDIRATGLTSDRFAAECARRAKVLLSAGTLFGPRGEGFARISFGGPEDDVLEGVRRCCALYGRLAGGMR
jgi:aspartate/methionine/tyrosine aminotransferase